MTDMELKGFGGGIDGVYNADFAEGDVIRDLQRFFVGRDNWFGGQASQPKSQEPMCDVKIKTKE